MLDELKVLLGGRVAEALVLKEISSGASNDLQRATQLARQMICEYGMSENIGPVTFGHRQDQVFLGRDIARDKDYSEEVAAEIDKEVRSFMEDAYAATEKLLSDNIDKLHVIAKALMEKETLEEEEINQLVKYGHILTAEEKLQLVQQSVVDEEIAAAPVADADVKAEALLPKQMYRNPLRMQTKKHQKNKSKKITLAFERTWAFVRLVKISEKLQKPLRRRR